MQVTSSASALLRVTQFSRAADAAVRRQEAATVRVADDGIAQKSEREKEDGKLLRGLQEVLSWLRESSSSASEVRKQAATRKADELRRQLQLLKKLMIDATPEQAKAFARQLRAIARQLTALAKELGNDSGGGAGDSAARAGLAAGGTSADASSAAQGTASEGAAATAAVSAASQASSGENEDEAAADGSESEAGAPAEAQQLAGMERAAAQAEKAEQQAREERQTGRVNLRGARAQKGSESDSQLRRVPDEARKELKGALAMLKARLPKDDRDVRAIEKSLSELEKQLGDDAPAVPAIAAGTYDAAGAAAPAVSATAGAVVGGTVSVQA